MWVAFAVILIIIFFITPLPLFHAGQQLQQDPTDPTKWQVVHTGSAVTTTGVNTLSPTQVSFWFVLSWFLFQWRREKKDCLEIKTAGQS